MSVEFIERPRILGIVQDVFTARIRCPDEQYVAYCRQCADAVLVDDALTHSQYGLMVAEGCLGVIQVWLEAFHPESHDLKYVQNADGLMGLNIVRT